MDIWVILGDIVVLLAASLLLGGLLSRFGQSPIVGYLLAGMMLGGPGSVHLVGSEKEIETIAELGVALLLFSLGLEFSVDRLRRLGTKPLLGGVLQVVVTTVLACGAAMVLGSNATESVAFGAMVSLSSTAVVLRMLMERAELEMPHGRNSLAVLLTQDMAVVPLALLMTILGEGGSPVEMGLEVGKLLLMAVALIAGLYLVIKVAVLALGTLTMRRNRELAVVFSVVTGLGAAWVSHQAGISPALGAFVAGMLLGSSAFATQVRADVSSLRVVLLTLFFGAAGMVADPVWIVSNWHVVALVTVSLTAGKLAVIWGIFAWMGQSQRVASATGLCLAQVGEFTFVLGSIGRGSGVVTEDMYALVVSVAIVSFFLGAFLVPAAPRFGDRVASWIGSKARQVDTTGDPGEGPETVIVGFGPAGQIAASPFIDKGTKVVVIDLNRDGVRKAEQLGFRGHVADATQSEVLEHIRLDQCKVIVITIPNHRDAMTILEHVRRTAPHVHVVARSRYQMHTDAFVGAGAQVAGDEEQVGNELANHLRHWLVSREDGTSDQRKPG